MSSNESSHSDKTKEQEGTTPADGHVLVIFWYFRNAVASVPTYLPSFLSHPSSPRSETSMTNPVSHRIAFPGTEYAHMSSYKRNYRIDLRNPETVLCIFTGCAPFRARLAWRA